MTAALASICESIDPPVRIIEPHVTRTPGTTKCGRVLGRILDRHGEEHVTLLLRTVMESENNRMALVEPILWAISDVMLANPLWPAKGLEWLDAFDVIDLCDIWLKAKDANGAPPERHGVASKLTEILQQRFGDGRDERLL